MSAVAQLHAQAPDLSPTIDLVSLGRQTLVKGGFSEVEIGTIEVMVFDQIEVLQRRQVPTRVAIAILAMVYQRLGMDERALLTKAQLEHENALRAEAGRLNTESQKLAKASAPKKGKKKPAKKTAKRRK